MYAPMIGISGAIHLFVKRPLISAAAVTLVIAVTLGMKSADPGPPPAPTAPSVPAIAFVKTA
jgi:hypothetical protein